jgi:hypothetical protein
MPLAIEPNFKKFELKAPVMGKKCAFGNFCITII